MDTPALDSFLDKVNAGIKYFEEHQEEAVQYISTKLDYEEEDAKEWMKTVRFARDVRGVKKSVIKDTVEMLQKAGVIDGEVWRKGDESTIAEKFVGILREED
ncbi:MAG: hypothetical protein Q9192_002849 [Flavoplaca navasiana]